MKHQATIAVLALAAVSILGLVLITQHTPTGAQVVRGTYYQEKLVRFDPNPYLNERKVCFHSVTRGCCTQACNKRFNIHSKEKLSLDQNTAERDNCLYYCYWGINP
ncbi:hypothetical protein HY641_04215 [Candidatus Woesearchaeota archaeon]|nr:hypothetical protein [Candidatus Woesearchaeota archaeon]